MSASAGLLPDAKQPPKVVGETLHRHSKFTLFLLISLSLSFNLRFYARLRRSTPISDHPPEIFGQTIPLTGQPKLISCSLIFLFFSQSCLAPIYCHHRHIPSAPTFFAHSHPAFSDIDSLTVTDPPSIRLICFLIVLASAKVSLGSTT